jgi:DNA-binding beta-propeller fold protein YncE
MSTRTSWNVSVGLSRSSWFQVAPGSKRTRKAHLVELQSTRPVECMAQGSAAKPAARAALARAVLLSGLVTAIFAVTAQPASAASGHRYSGQFGSPGAGNGEFSAPNGVAIEQTSGDVYVADSGNNRVERFDSAGTFTSKFDGSATPDGSFSSPSAVAIDQASGDVYVADSGHNVVDKFDPSGAYLTQITGAGTTAGAFSGIPAIAVDPNDGRLYIVDNANCVVAVYDSAGVFQSEIGTSGQYGFDDGNFFLPGGIAVDGASDVYVSDLVGRVQKFSGAGSFIRSAPIGSGRLAADAASNHLYVSLGDRVSDYDAAGNLVYSFGQARLTSAAGLAIDGSSAKVWVADTSPNAVLGFTPFTAPDVTTGAASSLATDGATLNGTVNPNGIPTTYHFDYGADSSYGNSTSESSPPDVGSSDVAATAPVAGLLPNTTYHYRLVARNDDGSNAGGDQTFTTNAAPPTISSPSASAITRTGATLNASINPEGSATTYHFEYGTDTGYGTATEAKPLFDSNFSQTFFSDQPVSASLTGLQPGTTYHYKVVADNGVGGPVETPDQTFDTAPPLPVANTGSATAVTAKSAHLTGSADTLGLPGSYRFSVSGVDVPGGTITDSKPLNGQTGTQPAAGDVAGLSPGHTYTFRLAVTTSSGTAYGEEQQFSTTGGSGNEVPIIPASDLGAAAYGCIIPHLDAYPKPVTHGQIVTLTGADLGVFGSVDFGAQEVAAQDYSSGGVTFIVPDNATGTALTSVNCGKASNAIELKVVSPSNRFSVAKKVKGTVATITVKVPGKGRVSVSGKLLNAATKGFSKAGTAGLTVRLSASGRKALAEHGRLKVPVSVRFTPTGGNPAAKTVSLTFNRKGRR